ncbi:MAG: urea transporter [Myxococcales bacterium]|nr:urea transporter [Myxococcales bacterium]
MPAESLAVSPKAGLTTTIDGAQARPALKLPVVPPAVAATVEGALNSYTQVFFARSPALGLALLAATLVVPRVGLWGLAGVLLANAIAVALQMDKEAVRGGLLGYNALLVFMALGGAVSELSAGALTLGLGAAVLVVLTHVALSGALSYHLRLPALSLPFVFVAWVVMAVAPHLAGVLGVQAAAPLLNATSTGPVTGFLSALGAVFFTPLWPAGLVVFLGLVAYSRIAAVHAVIGYAVALFVESVVFAGAMPDAARAFIGFNFIMTAVALGGIFYVPGRASLVVAAGGAFGCGLASVALAAWLAPLGLSLLALPFNLVTLLVLYALAQRPAEAAPRPVAFTGVSPEEALHYDRTRVQRFRTHLPVPLRPPFRGAWVCTQGNDGEHTHRGAWRHGLDFEVQDDQGRRHTGSGAEVTDWHCYRLPVVAMAAGTVVKVIDGLPDNAVGTVDTRHNWGNLVLVQHAPRVFSMVAHLSPGSIKVVEGQPVAAGAALGLCGNSGRSPMPHLHVQLQATPVVGDPTIPMAFHGVQVDGVADVPFVAVEHLPQRGQTLQALTRTVPMGQVFDWEPGDRFELTVFRDLEPTGETSRTEPVVAEVDLLGAKSLYSAERDARLWYENRGDVFVVYDYQGPRDSGLFAAYCALTKVPLVEAVRLGWTDHLNPRRLGRAGLAWFADALHAFGGKAEQAVIYRAARSGEHLRVHGLGRPGRWQRSVATEAVLTPGVGVKRLTAVVGGRRLVVDWARAAEGGPR